MPELWVRKAVPDDADLIVALVKELAAFEKAAPGTVRLRPEDVRHLAFGPGRRFEVLIGERKGRAEGLLVYYEIFSTWTAKPAFHVEDFFIQPSARGLGLGRRLIAALVAEAEKRGCGRIGLNVLDWNPARAFYERLGFSSKTEWLTYRLNIESEVQGS